MKQPKNSHACVIYISRTGTKKKKPNTARNLKELLISSSNKSEVPDPTENINKKNFLHNKRISWKHGDARKVEKDFSKSK